MLCICVFCIEPLLLFSNVEYVASHFLPSPSDLLDLLDLLKRFKFVQFQAINSAIILCMHIEKVPLMVFSLAQAAVRRHHSGRPYNYGH